MRRVEGFIPYRLGEMTLHMQCSERFEHVEHGVKKCSFTARIKTVKLRCQWVDEL